jgi:hypothetical protein
MLDMKETNKISTLVPIGHTKKQQFSAIALAMFLTNNSIASEVPTQKNYKIAGIQQQHPASYFRRHRNSLNFGESE